MVAWSAQLDKPTILVGDFNVAPLECDVWSHKQLLNVVSHTPIECELLARLQAANDWVDLGRKFVPAPQRLYTWWRSEEHTSELQSLMRISYAVFCLKKNNKRQTKYQTSQYHTRSPVTKTHNDTKHQ